MRRAVLAAALLACAPPLPAQQARYAVASWGTEQGLPSNAALNIEQTPDGYLWIGSYQGLVRFDGLAFRTFTENDIPGLSRASFWRLATDQAGALWAASETGGLVRYASGRWTVFRQRDGLKSDKVTAVRAGPGGVVWVGTRRGVSRFRNGRLVPLPAPRGRDEPTVADLATDGDGNLWIGTVANGLLRYRDGRYVPVAASSGLPDGRVTALYGDVDGAVWVGTYGAGVTRIQHGRMTRHADRGRAVPQRVNEMLRDPAGVLWAAADNGLFRLDSAGAVPVTLPGGRAITQATALHADREGNVWVGSRQGGLFRVRPAAVRVIGTADGLPDDLVYAVVGDGAGGVWLATQGGVAHRDGTGATELFTRESGALRDDVARDLIRARNGDVWVATNGGLTRIRGRIARTFTTRDGLADDRARTVFEGRDGTLWIGTYNGLTEMRGGRFRSYRAAQGLPDPFILSLGEDRGGTLWIGTQSEGLFRRAGGRFLPGPAALAHQPVFRITGDADGTLWVGSTRGLARLRGDSAVLLTTRDGLPGNSVFQALPDGVGRLWLTGPWGVGHVLREEVEAVTAGRAPMFTVKQYGRNDGLSAHEASSISHAWRAPDGALWFPTPAGAAVVQPGSLRRNVRPPMAIVERVVVDDRALAGEREVAPGARKLEFHFTATSFVAPEQLRFRYRLDGYDTGWVEGGTRRVAYYTNLPPGEYAFRVEARNEDGVVSRTPAIVRLRLRPHFWQTRWFLGLTLAAVFGLVYAAHRLRVSMVQRTVREEMLRDLSLHDDLTGLYNRRGLFTLAEQRARGAERQQRGFGVVFVDLDGLKRINDTHGHPIGDRALRDAATLLREAFPEPDVVARLAGDEFAVLVMDRGGSSAADEGCARLQRAMAAHNARAARPYHLSVSIGVSAFDPAHPAGLEALLAAADEQMYRQKRDKQPLRA